MPLLRECDVCGRIDREFDVDQPICASCERMAQTVRQEAFERMRAEFGAHVACQMTIVNMLRYVHETQPERFREMFGEYSEGLLKEALADLEVAKPV
jgi:hypothetical protein